MTAAAPSRPAPWLAIAMLGSAGVINYIDRSVLAIAAPAIAAEFGFTPEAMGLIFSAFFIGYVISCLIGGLAVDRFGVRLVLGIAMSVWSVFCGMTVLVVGFWTMMAVRLLFGFGEGPFNASINKAVHDWFPEDRRATALGIVIAGQPLGGALAGPVTGLLTAAFGWRAAFAGVCVIGLTWVCLWFALMRSGGKRVGTPGTPSPAPPPVQTPILPLILSRGVLGTTFAFFSFSYVVFFFASWFPSYLVKRFELDLATMSWLTVVPWLLGLVGLVSGGFLADAIARRVGDVLRARRLMLVGGLAIGGGCVPFAGLAGHVELALAAMGIGLFAIYATGPSYWAALQAIVPARRLGGVGGFMAMVATTSGIIAPAVTGLLVARSGGFASSFALAGLLAFAGALVAGLFVTARRAA